MPRLILVLFCLAPVLSVTAQEPTGSRDLLVVVDCSGSMLGKAQDGEVKLEAARRVLLKLVEQLPDNLNVGLMAYGHRMFASDAGTCTDIELVVPVVATDKPRLAEEIRGLQGKGRTPIAASLLKAGETLKALGAGREKSLIVVTDGIETCGGDPQAAARALQELGIKLDFVVVGFDLAESEAKATAAIAEAGKGKYLDAKSAKALEGAFEDVRKSVVVRAPEVGKGEIVGNEGPGWISMVGLKEGEFPTVAVLIATRVDDVKELPRGEGHGLVFADFFGHGARLGDIPPDSPAAKAGLARGDLVVRADDLPVTTARQLADFLAAKAGAEDAGKPWRLKIARFPLACEVLATWIDVPKQEVPSGHYFVFLSGSLGSGNCGTEGIDANALAAGGSWVSPIRWSQRVEAKMTVEIPLNTGFRFMAGQTKHDPEDEVRIVDDASGLEVLRFSAATLGRYEWEEAPAVISLPAGTYSMDWRRREGKSWFGIVKGHTFDGNSLIDVKF